MGLGLWEIAVVAGVFLLLFGPNQFTKALQQLGRGVAYFRQGFDAAREDLSVPPPCSPPTSCADTQLSQDASASGVDAGRNGLEHKHKF